MYAVFGLALAAIGATLKYAVADKVDGVDLSTVGVILMIVGVIGLLMALVSEAMRRNRRVDRVVETPHGAHHEEVHHH